MSFETKVDSYVDFIVETAQNQQSNTLLYTETAQAEFDRLIGGGNITTGNYLKDLVFSGNENFNNFNTITDLRNEFDSKYHYLLDTLLNRVPEQFSGFIDDYFPKPTNFDNLEKFLCDSVFNGSIGLPPEIEKQIWEQERERTILENNRVIIENRKSMSSRGFMEPDGVEMYREMIIMNQGSKNISGSSRQIAIDSAKLKIDWVKFAVSEAKNYRALAIDSAFKYLSSILSLNDSSFKYASGYVDSYKTFYDTLNAYFNSVNNINRLNFDKASTLDKLSLESYLAVRNLDAQRDKLKVDTAIDNAKTVATLASAGLSAMNTIASHAQTAVS